jgi:hypothetical protein
MRFCAAPLLTATVAATLALACHPVEAKPPQPHGKSLLQCKIVFGPGAQGSVQLAVDAGRGTSSFTAAVEADPREDGGGVPLFEVGDQLAVSVMPAATRQPFAAGTITLAQDAGTLEGSLRFASPARGRNAGPFPAGFPALAAGDTATLGAQSCVLQARGHKG